MQRTSRRKAQTAAAATAFATGPYSFYLIRFLLGVFEAEFFPGVIWYISIWFPARYRTSVLAMFMAATPLSSLVGSPISAALPGMDGLWGLGGWQWRFLIEGLPACVLGIFCLIVLADTPDKATWLTPQEREALVNELANEKYEKPKKDLWAAMKDIRVLMLTAITFAFTIGSYGIDIWLPLILKNYGLTNIGRCICVLGAMPMVLIAGPKGGMKSCQAGLQVVDVVRAFKPLTKMSRQIVSTATIPTVNR
ncbi:MFS transporter [Bradyrhizobium sp. Pa8]|uniref:MFS transporter n=1 Tax=Bradyrhizobium sp. Pa8 TaxID=3386552 RepID=UPI00403F9ED7